MKYLTSVNNYAEIRKIKNIWTAIWNQMINLKKLYVRLMLLELEMPKLLIEQSNFIYIYIHLMY